MISIRTASVFASLGFVFLFHAVAGAGPNYELNSIRGTVDNADDRLKNGQLDNARYFVKSASDSMAKAKPETKSDPEFAQLQKRLEDIDKQLAKREGAAGKDKDVAAKLQEAADSEQAGRIAGDNDQQAMAAYGKCIAALEAAYQIDGGARSRRAESAQKTGAELEKLCRDGLAKAKKQSTGEGLQRAAETEEGKSAVAAYVTARKAVETKKLQAADLIAGQQAADTCRNKLGPLRGLQRNNKPYYDAKTEKLPTPYGEMTMESLDIACAKAQTALKDRTAFGCGKKPLNVSQSKSNNKWGKVGLVGGPTLAYQAIGCDEMPKASAFPGLSAKYRAMYESSCGKDAIYVIVHSNWAESGSYRQMGGACFKKGELRFLPKSQ